MHNVFDTRLSPDHIVLENLYEKSDALIDICILVFKDEIISLYPYTPTSSNHYLHKYFTLISAMCINDHLMKIEISISFHV